MNATLAKEQIEQYQKDGFLIVRGFLSPAEVEELRAEVVKTAQAMGNKKVAGGGVDWEAGDEYYDRVFTQRMNLWRINQTVKRYMLSPEISQMIRQLENQPGFRVWHDQTLIKEPWANPTSIHLDNPYWAFYSKNAISIWIALDDATLQNGCMTFLPGTHREAQFELAPISEDVGGIFKAYPQWKSVEPVVAEMKAGDASFHNGLLAHGAGANLTPRRRVAMTCAYMPEGSTFNGRQNVLPDDYFHSLKEGDVLENDDWNPVVGRPDASSV